MASEVKQEGSLVVDLIESEKEEDETEGQLETEDRSRGAECNSPIQYVTIKKVQGEPLGITLALEEYGDIVVSRILQDSLVDKEGLINVNDIIREVDNIPMKDPDHVIKTIAKAGDSFKLTIVKSYKKSKVAKTSYVKAHFTYDPKRDRLIPCKEAGLPFNDGDILEIVNSEDSNWWQAKVVGKEGRTGLIPAKVLEEKRKAYIKHDRDDSSSSSLLCGLGMKKKKKYKYNTKANADFDGGDVMVYEEVTRVPGFKRGLVLLVGANGVGKRSLKARLFKEDPKRCKGAVLHTSRHQRKNELNGVSYYFTDREKMEDDISENKYIEYGIYKKHLYGIRLETICKVMNSGRTCVLDVNPVYLKVLKTSQFMPHVIFIAAPSVEVMQDMYNEGQQRRKKKEKRRDRGHTEPRTEEDFRQTVEESAQIEQTYKSYFDTIIVNDSFAETCKTLRSTIDSLRSEEQWVPVNWVFK